MKHVGVGGHALVEKHVFSPVVFFKLVQAREGSCGHFCIFHSFFIHFPFVFHIFHFIWQERSAGQPLGVAQLWLSSECTGWRHSSLYAPVKPAGLTLRLRTGSTARPPILSGSCAVRQLICSASGQYETGRKRTPRFSLPHTSHSRTLGVSRRTHTLKTTTIKP